MRVAATLAVLTGAIDRRSSSPTSLRELEVSAASACDHCFGGARHAMPATSAPRTATIMECPGEGRVAPGRAPLVTGTRVLAMGGREGGREGGRKGGRKGGREEEKE